MPGLVTNILLEEPATIMPAHHDSACHLDLIGSGSEEDTGLWLRYYADEKTRQDWRARFPEDVIPPHEDPPWHRDTTLPQRGLRLIRRRSSRPRPDLRTPHGSRHGAGQERCQITTLRSVTMTSCQGALRRASDVDHLLGHAAVDDEVLAGDKARGRRDQVRHHLGHVGRHADPAGRMLGVVRRTSVPGSCAAVPSSSRRSRSSRDSRN